MGFKNPITSPISKYVEIATSCRKGRTGTAAGDLAFPKEKENLASVLKRYKRRLTNKPVGVTPEGPGSRKVPHLHHTACSFVSEFTSTGLLSCLILENSSKSSAPRVFGNSSVTNCKNNFLERVINISMVL